MRPQPAFRLLLVGACAAVLLASAASSAFAGSFSAHRARGAPRVLVVKHAANPVLGALRQSFGGHLQIDRSSAPRRGKAAPHRLGYYNLLVLDGDNLSPRQMARARLLSRFAASGRWVLAFDLRPADFRRALRHQTGFWARAAGHKRRVFLFRRTMVDGSPEVQMIEASRLAPQASGSLSKGGRRRAASLATQRVAGMIAAALHGKVPGQGGSSTAPRSGSLASSSGDAVIPPELQHIGWSFTQVGEAKLPGGYWTKNKGSETLTGVPPPGSQTANWRITHNFDVYLDNSEGHPQGNSQIISYELSGEFSPKLPHESFVQMFRTFEVGLEKKILERAWWTGTFEDLVTPMRGTNDLLQWKASQPSTPNAETNYSSGSSFKVGFSASNKGAGANASYSVSNEQGYSIPNWGVENRGSGNDLAWRFSARSSKEGECDVRPGYNKGCFHGDGTPNLPSELSLGQFQPHASGWWRSKSVLKPGTKLRFEVESKAAVMSTRCSAWAVYICGPYHWDIVPRSLYFSLPWPAPIYEIDAGAVVPIPVKSLSFSHNPADGSVREPVTGTVELARPAAMDTHVIVYSNNPNAVLGPPIDGGPGSQRTIVIPEGKARGEFKILTNDNQLKPGEHTTAAITAFYSEATTKQLRIEAAPR
jgi:hypothetical protein